MTTQNYSPLAIKIQKEYTALIKTIQSIPFSLYEEKVLDGTGGKVSIRDLIAYQIGWGKLLIGWYEAGLKNQIPEMPGEGFSNWDYTGLANHFYNKYHYDRLEKQLKEFQAVVKHILIIVEKEHQTGHLDQIGKWKWCTLQSGKEWPLNKWITINTAAPYKRAAQLIRKYFKTAF